jgi:hypothetical protein
MFNVLVRYKGDIYKGLNGFCKPFFPAEAGGQGISAV